MWGLTELAGPSSSLLSGGLGGRGPDLELPRVKLVVALDLDPTTGPLAFVWVLVCFVWWRGYQTQYFNSTTEIYAATGKQTGSICSQHNSVGFPPNLPEKFPIERERPHTDSEKSISAIKDVPIGDKRP